MVLLHAFADSSLAFTPLLATPLADRFRLVAPDLAGFGASPPHHSVRAIADHAEAVAALVASLSTRGPVGLVAHSVASMIAVEAAPLLGPQFAGLFSIEGNLTAEDAYFSGRAADFARPLAFKQRFLDDLWSMAQEQVALRRYFAGAVLADATAMWELGRDARRTSIDDEPGQVYRRIRPSLYYWSPATPRRSRNGGLRNPESHSDSSLMRAIGPWSINLRTQRAGSLRTSNKCEPSAAHAPLLLWAA